MDPRLEPSENGQPENCQRKPSTDTEQVATSFKRKKDQANDDSGITGSLEFDRQDSRVILLTYDCSRRRARFTLRRAAALSFRRRRTDGLS
jgi:hypothetical protein